MKVLIFDNAEEATQRVAEFVCAAIIGKPNSVLGLATGGTMMPLYALLRRKYNDGVVSFTDVTTFNLDEYIGLNPEHQRWSYISDHFTAQLRWNMVYV